MRRDVRPACARSASAFAGSSSRRRRVSIGHKHVRLAEGSAIEAPRTSMIDRIDMAKISIACQHARRPHECLISSSPPLGGKFGTTAAPWLSVRKRCIARPRRPRKAGRERTNRIAQTGAASGMLERTKIRNEGTGSTRLCEMATVIHRQMATLIARLLGFSSFCY